MTREQYAGLMKWRAEHPDLVKMQEKLNQESMAGWRSFFECILIFGAVYIALIRPFFS